MRQRIGSGVLDLRVTDRCSSVTPTCSVDFRHRWQRTSGRPLQNAGPPPNCPRTHVDLSSGLGSHGGMVRVSNEGIGELVQDGRAHGGGQNADGTNAVDRDVYSEGSCHAPSGPRMMAEPTRNSDISRAQAEGRRRCRPPVRRRCFPVSAWYPPISLVSSYLPLPAPLAPPPIPWVPSDLSPEVPLCLTACGPPC